MSDQPEDIKERPKTVKEVIEQRKLAHAERIRPHKQEMEAAKKRIAEYRAQLATQNS